MRQTHGVGRASLPEPDSIWPLLLQQLQPGAFRSVLAIQCHLETLHPHGLTIAAPSCWLPLLGERRELLERAASRAMGGRPMVVHLIASDAEPAGGAQ